MQPRNLPPQTNLGKRRELQRAAVGQLEAALRDGSDADVVKAAAQVRALGAHAGGVHWDAVYLVETRFRNLWAFREARQVGDDDAVAVAWSELRGQWGDYLTLEEQQAGRAAFKTWGRRLRKASSAARTSEDSQ